jgi:regulator of sirC expression with transglutaminase-like and TPR domain
MINDNEIKALISLLDDEDQEITEHVEQKIRELGGQLIPYLESEWEDSFSPIHQKKIEELIHDLQYQSVLDRIRLWKETGGIDLLEGLWIVATYQYPDLSLDKIRLEIKQLYLDVWLEGKSEMHPIDQIKTLNTVFFNKLKFAANTKHFHSPSNSMINVVLESRRGNPISLCVIYMLIAQQLDLPVYGVNLPSLFVLTYKKDHTQFYINVFNRGLVFSKSDIDHYIGQLNLKPADTYYQPCTNLDIIRRVLRNLMLAFEKIGDTGRVKEVEQLLDAVYDEDATPPLSDYTNK